VKPAVEPGLDRGRLDPLDRLRRETPVGALGLLLERDQHIVDEPAGSLPQLRELRA
jgi:hypothetical protein